MRTRNCLRWGLLSISCLALLTFSAQTGRPQPVPGISPPPPSDDKAPLPPIPAPIPDFKPPPTPPVHVPTPAPPPTVEDLIKQLELLRKQKAELERQEQAVVAKLQERLKDQGDRLNKLGLITPPPPPPQPEVKDAVDTTAPKPKDPGRRDTDKN